MRSEVRAPRLRFSLDGADLPGAVAADIHSNNHLSADRFRARLASSVVSLNLLQTPGLQLTVSIGLDDAWAELVTGLIDSVHYDPVLRTVDLEGRDLSAALIETQTNETFANRTSSEIATTLAARHALGSLVTPTTTQVGRYYQAEHDRLGLGQLAKTMTEWDLLAFLAAREGFDLFVTGQDLVFAPPSVSGAGLIAVSDCIGLKLDHCVALSRPIEVTVKSWSTKTGSSVQATANSGGIGSVFKQVVTRPNLTFEEAEKLAARVLGDLKLHEWSAAATIPGELMFDARSQVVLTGTDSAWDRAYDVIEVSRHIDVRRGFTERLLLRGA